MGYRLYDESGVFDPAAYGLGAGDTITVVCVGGGAGGSAIGSSSDSGVGGNGGASSFGSYITAAGGLAQNPGGSTIVTQEFSNQPGVAKTGGGYAAGGAGGGWLPGAIPSSGLDGIGVALGTIAASGSVSDYRSIELPVSRTGQKCTGAPGSFSYSMSNGAPYPGIIPQMDFFVVYIATQSNSKFDGYIRCIYPVRGGNCIANACQGGSGGAGYGAGGGGYQNYNQFAASGGSGQIITKTITLESDDPIAVTIGGGGGGGYARSNANGGDGGPGTAGTAGYTGAGAGGYPGAGADSTNSSGAGGGAGGCVAIYW